MTTAPQSLDDALAAFAAAEGGVPTAAIIWAQTRWEEAEPRFLALLSSVGDGGEITDQERVKLLVALHLLAEAHAAAAFPILVRLAVEQPERFDDAFGDTVGATLEGVLISLYDGDFATLARLIESPSANEFVRAAGFEALAYLTRVEAAIPEDQTRACLRRLRTELQPQAESYVWNAWADAVAILGYEDLADDVYSAMSERLVDDAWMEREDFDELLETTLEDPQGLAGLEAADIAPFTDALSELSEWHIFTPEYLDEKARRARGETIEDDFDEEFWNEDGELDEDDEGVYEPAPPQPVTNPYRDVGRNAPCPCGSGKKFKKCCLEKAG